MENLKALKFRRILSMVFASALIVFLVLFISFRLFPNLERRMLIVLDDRSLSLVDVAYDIVSKIHDMGYSGKVQPEEALQTAKTFLRNARYGKEGYFWVISPDGRIVVHPYHPDLEGLKPEEVNDEELKRRFEKAISAVLDGFRRGENSAEYEWYVYETGELERKRSVFKYFKPWNWIIGTGVYEKDVKDFLKTEKRGLVKLMWTFLVAFISLTVWMEYVIFKGEMEERKLLGEILLEKSRLETLISNVPNPIAMKDIDLRYVYVNEAFARFCSKNVEEILGKRDEEIFEKERAEILKKCDERVLKERKPVVYEFKREISGSVSWFVCRKIPILNPQGGVDGVVCVLNEITGLKREVMRLQDEADTDPLTGLANRNFLEKLKRNIPKRLAEGKFAVVMIDLDGFKRVNDTMGHSTGDAVLKEVAKRMERSVRGDTLVMRYGGDEFLLVASIEDRKEVEAIVERVLRSISQVIRVSGREISVGASAGISVYPDDGFDLDMLIEKADSAMYLSKSSSKGGYRFYSQTNSNVV